MLAVRCRFALNVSRFNEDEKQVVRWVLEGMILRQHVHELIDRLPPTQLTVVAGLLEAMLDPVSRRAGRDEEISEEEGQAVARVGIS